MLKAAQQPLLPGSRHQHDKLHRSSLNGIAGFLVSFALVYISWSHAIQVQLLPSATTTALQLQLTPTSSDVGNCAVHPKPAVALCMLLLGYNNANMPRQLWLAVANRKAYAVQHGYPHYMAVQPFGSGRHPMWEKFIAVHAVMQHSCADWVWMLDSDAFIMNLQRDVLALAHNPTAVRRSKAECNSSSPDIIGAGACLTKINTGSVLLRNTNWTKQFLGDTWHSEHIARPVKWADQAGVLHMLKQAGVKEHVCLVQGRSINALTDEQTCQDGFGHFKDGDLVVHFPGAMKQYIASNSSKWLPKVQTRPSSMPDTLEEDCTASVGGTADDAGADDTACGTCAGTFILGGASLMAQPSTAGRVLHVSFQSTMHGTEFGSLESYNVVIEPQSEGCDNWGWPVAQQHAPPEHLVDAAAVLVPVPESKLSGQASPVDGMAGEGQQGGTEGEETGGDVQEGGEGDLVMPAETEAGQVEAADVVELKEGGVGASGPGLVPEGTAQGGGGEGVVGADLASLSQQQVEEVDYEEEEVQEVV